MVIDVRAELKSFSSPKEKKKTLFLFETRFFLLKAEKSEFFEKKNFIYIKVFRFFGFSAFSISKLAHLAEKLKTLAFSDF
jgi:hypothetical protein